MDTLTIQQAFLEDYYERTQSDDVGALLGDLQCMEDGVPADPAAWQDWLDCVKSLSNALLFDICL